MSRQRDRHRDAKWAGLQRQTPPRSSPLRGAWQHRLKACGLRVEIEDKERFEARGQRRATRLRVLGECNEGVWSWQLTAHNKHIPSELTLLPEPSRHWLTEVLGHTDQTIGDSVLEGIAQLQGPPDRVLAVLSHATRVKLRELIAREGSVRDRTVRLQATSPDPHPVWLPERTHQLSQLSGHLSVHPKKVPQALIHTVDHDPLASLRAEAFRVLLRDHAQRAPARLLTEERLLPLLDELGLEALVRALEALGSTGSVTCLPLIAPFTHFPRGNNATRKAARKAVRTLTARTASEDGFHAAVPDPGPEGERTVSPNEDGPTFFDDH